MWAAITDTDLASRWLLDGPMAEGGTVETERPGELIRYRMPDGGTMQFELLSGMAGTILALSRRVLTGAAIQPATKARWHVSLDALAWHLSEAPGFPTEDHLAAIAPLY